MRVIRASEISTYIFCQRAWWYQANGYSSSNYREIEAGRSAHTMHARAAAGIRFAQITATILFLASLVILIFIRF